MAKRIGRETVPLTVGDTELARWFYAGRYAEILTSTYDADGVFGAADLAFVVGALTFVNRLDEAEACYAGWTARGVALDRRTRVATRFFLGLAATRAGNFDRGSKLLVAEAFADRHATDPWIRAFVFQGLALQCYFIGRYPGAARHALRALQAAHEAGFLYVAMLGTDLRGHALCQIGQLQRGITMLEQAKGQAHRLGLTNNAFAVDASIATYVTRFVPEADSLARVEALLRRRVHDSYSRRTLLIELAVQYALRGRRREASEAMIAADHDALRSDTRRAKVATFLARLWVTRWQEGAAACGPLLTQLAPLLEPRDLGFRAELLGFEILVARIHADAAREQRAVDELRAIWKASQHVAAKAALGQFDLAGPVTAFDEDAMTPVLRAVVHRDTTALARIVSLGVHGVIPELLGLVPGRRIILIPGEDLLLLEDHGEVVVRQRPPRWCPLLLRILASGNASKERIVEGLWGLRSYHPELHDPPVRTTIHRLRTFLQPHGAWIEVSDDGYRTAVPVHVVSGSASLPEPTLLWEEGEVPTLDRPRHVAVSAARELPREEPVDVVLQRLTELEQATVTQLARSLELSASTVLRALRELVRRRHVERVGFARATRYRLRSASARR
jgi:hypothetical protein